MKHDLSRPLLINLESKLTGQSFEMSLPFEAATVSLVCVSLIDVPGSARYFGRVWRKPAGGVMAQVTVQSDDATLAIAGEKLISTFNWNQSSLATNSLARVVIEIEVNGPPDSINTKIQHDIELIPVSSGIVELAEALALRTQGADKRIWSTLSRQRFKIFNSYKTTVAYTGKRVLLSGCAGGNEAAVIRDMGASFVLGVDTDQAALELARARFFEQDRVEFADRVDQTTDLETFDIAVSRHVLEHVGNDQKASYVSELFDRLKPGGLVIIDVPNQQFPIEPHTNVEFFHMLSRADQDHCIRYFQYAAERGLYETSKINLLLSLLGHRNVSYDEFMNWLPAGTTIQNVYGMHPKIDDVDMAFSETLRFECRKSNAKG